MRRALPILFGLAASTATASASAFEAPVVGGHEGEIDVAARFEGHLGRLEPTPRPTTHQPADIKVFGLSAGLTLGDLGPFLDFQVRLDGGYYIAAPEAVTEEGDDLPVGFPFHPEDQGGWVRATVSSNLVRTDRLAFGASIEGTVPIDVDLAKFSNVRIHYAGGGTHLGLHITDPDAVVRLNNLTRMFIGSGAYGRAGQHNAQVDLQTLFYLETRRWLLPWRAGLGAGPRFFGDLNEHVNDAYHQAYGALTPDLVAAERVRQMRLGGVASAFVFVTPHASLHFRFDEQLSGQDARATRRFEASLRAAF